METKYKQYKKSAVVKAKIFKKGDEDGFVHCDGLIGAMEDAKYGVRPKLIPYVITLENQYFKGEFGENYICIGINNERWLVKKTIFENTYEAVL